MIRALRILWSTIESQVFFNGEGILLNRLLPKGAVCVSGTCGPKDEILVRRDPNECVSGAQYTDPSSADVCV
jgi:hypothetical protein